MNFLMLESLIVTKTAINACDHRTDNIMLQDEYVRFTDNCKANTLKGTVESNQNCL